MQNTVMSYVTWNTDLLEHLAMLVIRKNKIIVQLIQIVWQYTLFQNGC